MVPSYYDYDCDNLFQSLSDTIYSGLVELNKVAGDPIAILVNGKLVAIGEVVVIDENFGIRIVDILK